MFYSHIIFLIPSSISEIATAMRQKIRDNVPTAAMSTDYIPPLSEISIHCEDKIYEYET
jgi:hypothetical protein